MRRGVVSRMACRRGAALVRAPPGGDLAELADLGNALNEQIAWRHESARLDQ